MSWFPCSCCKCFPQLEVPVTTVTGATEVSSEWAQRSTGPRCCWIKYFDYDGTPSPILAYQAVYHVRLDSSVDYQWTSNVYGVVMTGNTEFKLEKWIRLKASATPVPDPVTGHYVSVTWSKICGAVCGDDPPTDYWVLEYTQRLDVVLTEEKKAWGATKYVNTQTGVVARTCSFSYDDGKWEGGTEGGTYVTNSSTVPAQEDLWSPTGVTLYSATIEIRRYKLFAVIPVTPTSVDISESEIIPDCKKTLCMVDAPFDGSLAYSEYDEGFCYSVWSIVTDTAMTECFGFMSVGPGNHIENQGGTNASGSPWIEHLLVAPCRPHIYGPGGIFHCSYIEYSNLVFDSVCEDIGAGTFYVAPSMDLVISAAP